MSPAEARLKEVPSEMTEAEWSQRVNLAACYRLVAHYGWDDLVDTHISARVPGPEHHFLINPYGLMFDEITASSLVKVDLDGNQLTKSDYSINPAGFTIHSAIHEVREDAGCVLHLHTPDGTAVASCMEGLLPLNQTAQLVTHDLAYHDYEGIALDHDERPRLQKDLGNKNHMLLRNHGTLTVGRSVASAFERMFHLERACTMQVRTRMLGPTAYPVDQAVIDKNTSVFAQSRSRGIAFDHAGVAAAAAQARPARSQLQELKFRENRCSIAANNLCTSIQNAAQFRAAFSFCGEARSQVRRATVALLSLFGRASAQPRRARMRAHERMPLWKLFRSYFSFGEWMLSSSRPKPTITVSRPRVRLKSATIGIDAPEPDQHRLLAPLVGQRAPGGGERLHVPVERDGRRAGMVGEFGLAIRRAAAR